MTLMHHSTYRRTDAASVFFYFVVLAPLFSWLLYLLSMYAISPQGLYQGKSVTFLDLDLNTQLQCNLHTPLWFTQTANDCKALLRDTGLLASTIVHIKLSLLLGVTVAGFTAYAKRRFLDDTHHVRGIRRLDGKEAEKHLKQYTGQEAKSDKKAIQVLPYLSISSDRMSLHGGVFGGTGSGKTQIFLSYLNHILRGNHKVVLHDVKGDFTSWLPNALILGPADDRTAIWDIGRDVYSRPTIVDFASYLIPEPEGQKDPFWSNAARMMLTGFITKLVEEKKNEWGWFDLATLVQMQSEDWEELLEEYEPAALEYIANTGSNLSIGVQAELKSHFQLVGDIANAWGIDHEDREKISMEEWLLDDEPKYKHIILQNNIEIKQASKFWIGAFFNYATKYSVGVNRSKHSKTPNWFFIDEINSMSKQASITDIINLGREKKSFVFIGCQTISLLYRQYSVEEIDTWLNSIGTLWIGKHGRGGGADKAAGLSGRREIKSLQENRSHSKQSSTDSTTHRYAGEMQQVLLASELSGQLGKHDNPKPHIKISVLGFGETVCIIDLPILAAQELREGYIAAPWMKAEGYKRIKSPELEAKRLARREQEKAEKAEKRRQDAEANALARADLTTEIVKRAADLTVQSIANVVDANSLKKEEPKQAEPAPTKDERIVEAVADNLRSHQDPETPISETIDAFAGNIVNSQPQPAPTPMPAPKDNAKPSMPTPRAKRRVVIRVKKGAIH